ncbi:elongation factor [Tasmannia lanceolata]|uniref:elongation factor n=1 Tax=Tasmannia lanceolata TaxID=3420 RepID=UPI0040642E30
MGPAQVLMSSDLEIKQESPEKFASARENGNQLEITDGNGLKCANNCEDNTFDAETLLEEHKIDDSGDLAVDILDCADTRLNLSQAEDPDATEYSSSFGDTMSGSNDGSKLNLSDAEVESQFFCEDGSSAIFDGMFRMRKKKLTPHWRRYIRPLMWRCKWIELRAKEFQSKASKYDKELSAIAHVKQSTVGCVASESSTARSVPFSRQSHRKQVMKRRKRKRIEDTADIPSYMSHHNLFSYYENKRSEADGVSVDDDCGNQVTAPEQNINSADEFGANFEWPVPKFRDGDSSFEQILWSIETLQSRVVTLRTQLDNVVSRNAGKFNSMENLGVFMPVDLPSSSALSPTLSPGNGDVMPVGALYTPPGHISEYEIGDLVMPGSAVSSFGDASLPDIIESTVGLLSAADASLDHPRIGDSCEDIADGILIHNQAATEELQNFEVVSQPIEKALEPVKREESEESVAPIILVPKPEPVPEMVPAPATEPETIVSSEEPILKTCSESEVQIHKYKRKRVERRAGSGHWRHAEKVLKQEHKHDSQ